MLALFCGCWWIVYFGKFRFYSILMVGFGGLGWVFLFWVLWFGLLRVGFVWVSVVTTLCCVVCTLFRVTLRLFALSVGVFCFLCCLWWFWHGLVIWFCFVR